MAKKSGVSLLALQQQVMELQSSVVELKKDLDSRIRDQIQQHVLNCVRAELQARNAKKHPWWQFWK